MRSLLAKLARLASEKLAAYASLADSANCALQHRLRLLEQTVEQCPSSIVVTSPAGKIEYVNPAFERLTGYSRSEALGKCPSMLSAGTQPPSFYADLWATILSGKIWSGNFHNRKKNGESFWERASISPIHDASGAIANFVAVKEDVTAQRRKETELREACAKAVSADKAKNVFLATMSHELRTPLNTIIGLSSVMQEECPDPHSKTSLDYIQRSGEHLLRLIEDILQLTRDDGPSAAVESAEFELLPLLCDVLQSASSLAEQKQVELQYDFDPQLPARVVSDPTRLKQALSNLVTNGIKYTECGYVKLVVQAASPTDSEPRIRFSVYDTGVGIEPQHIERIFEPFFQVESCNRRRYGGAGLGLAICKQIVGQLGGELSVVSAARQGSVFNFSLPTPNPSNRGELFAALARPELAGARIVSTFFPEALQNTLAAVARSCSMPIKFVHPRELEDACAQQTDIVLVDRSAAEEGRAFCAAHPELSILWHGPSAPRGVAHIAPYSLPYQLADSLALCLKSRPALPPKKVLMPLRASPKLAESLPLSILAVDDIETNRKVIKIILEHLGYQADIACGGGEFLRCVARKRYDLVLLDLQMPDIDGLEAFRLLKACPPPHDLPKVVALTANALDTTRNECLAAGMAGHLPKPVNPRIVKECIAALFATEAPESPTLQPNPLDRAHLQAIAGELEPDAVRELFEGCHRALRADLDRNLDTIKAACDAKDHKKLAPLVHGLKGGYAMLGWIHASSFCADALRQLRADQFEDFESFVPLLLEHHQIGSHALDQYLAKQGSYLAS